MRNEAGRRNSAYAALAVLSLLAFSSCAQDPVFLGLKPLDPVSRTDCTLIASRQPMLRWQAFAPGEATGSTPAVSDVTYELRIWEAVHDAPGKLVYAREGLSEPSHAVQEPLSTTGSYYWSVRARFLLNGMVRVTDWGQQRQRVIEVPQLHDRRTDHEYYQYYCFRIAG